jgi:hypothetical protein
MNGIRGSSLEKWLLRLAENEVCRWCVSELCLVAEIQNPQKMEKGGGGAGELWNAAIHETESQRVTLKMSTTWYGVRESGEGFIL